VTFLVLRVQGSCKVLRSLQLPDLGVSSRFEDANDKGLDLPHVLFTNRQVDAEPVPRVAVAITEVMLEAPTQVRSKADVVEALASVEGVDPVAAADVRADQGLVLLEELAGHALQVLADELRVASQGKLLGHVPHLTLWARGRRRARGRSISPAERSD
jgi:hypothetical protein